MSQGSAAPRPMKLISALARSLGLRWVSLWQLLGARGGEQRSGPWPEECRTKWKSWRMLNRREESMQKIADKSVWALWFWFISLWWASNLQTGRVTCFGTSVRWFVNFAFSCVLPIPLFVFTWGTERFAWGAPHLTKTTSPSRRRLVGLVSHDVSRRGSKRLPVTNGVLNHMPHRHYSALSVVFWPPVRPSTKAGLVAPGDALQKHQFPLQAAKGWFADKPTVKKDAKDSFVEGIRKRV